MQSIYKSIAVLVLFLASTGLVRAQQEVTIKGQVKDAEGKPLPQVTIRWKEEGMYSDEDGKYEFTTTLEDTLEVTYNFPGMQRKTVTITDATASPITKNITLKTSRSMGVTIETEKFQMRAEEVTSSMDVIDPKRAENFAANELQQTVEQTSGVTINDGQPSIRGSSGYTYGSGTRVVTLLNGMPMLNADRNSAQWAMLPTDNIRQIEIFKGASSVLYGAGAMGGVINVITQRPADTPRTVVRGGLRLYDKPPNDTADWDGRSSALNPNIHFFHSRRIGNLDFTTQVDTWRETGYVRNDYSKRIRMLTMLNYHIPVNAPWIENLTAGVNAQFYRDSTSDVLAWGFPEGYPKSALQSGSLIPASKQLLFKYSVDPHVTLETEDMELKYQGRTYHAVNEVSTGQSGSSTLFYNELQALRNFGDNFSIVAGGVHRMNDADADSTFGDSRAIQMGAYAQARLEIGRQLNLMVGARYQYENIRGDTASTVARKGEADSLLFEKNTISEPVFRAGINYHPFQGTFFRASFGEAVRSPSIAERFTTTQIGGLQVLPAPNIEVERGWTAELGARQLYSLGDFSGFVDVSGFWMEFNNMVDFYFDDRAAAQGRLAFRAQNVARARINGVEVNANTQWDINDETELFVTSGVTYTNPIDLNGKESWNGDDSARIVQDAAFSLLDGNPVQNLPQDRPEVLKYRNRWIVRSSANLEYKNWGFTTNLRYTSRMVNVDKIFLTSLVPGARQFRTTHPKGWTELDFILSYTLNGKYTFSGHVFNALNAEYMTIPGTLGEQRQFALQFKMEI